MEFNILELGRRIKELRTNQSTPLTTRELGEILHVANTTISSWERGESVPSAENIFKICRHFSLPSDILLGLSDY